MDLALYLRPEEQAVFDKLPPSLRDGWEVRKEMLTAEERPEELKMRRLMFRPESYPGFSDLLKNARKEDARSVEKLLSLPAPVLRDLFFTIGSKGLSLILQSLLGKVRSDEDIKGLAEVSAIRHALLEENVPSHSS